MQAASARQELQRAVHEAHHTPERPWLSLSLLIVRWNGLPVRWSFRPRACTGDEWSLTHHGNSGRRRCEESGASLDRRVTLRPGGRWRTCVKGIGGWGGRSQWNGDPHREVGFGFGACSACRRGEAARSGTRRDAAVAKSIPDDLIPPPVGRCRQGLSPGCPVAAPWLARVKALSHGPVSRHTVKPSNRQPAKPLNG